MNQDGVQYKKTKFIRISGAKLKKRFLLGPQISKLMTDEVSISILNKDEKGCFRKSVIIVIEKTCLRIKV